MSTIRREATSELRSRRCVKGAIDGTLRINTTDSTHAAGGVAFAGYSPRFDNLKIGYDYNDDDDIDDANDDVVVNETFGPALDSPQWLIR